MNWTKASKYVLIADDGVHKIVKVLVNGVPRYELWRDTQLLSAHASAEEAKAAV